MASLTPNHFLAGSASTPIIAAPWPPIVGGLAKRWEAVQRALEVFRKRFAAEVLIHLREATQARGAGRDLQVGDVVVFLLPSAHKKWPLALIHQTFPGRDGRVRVVDLWAPQTSGGDAAPARPIRNTSVDQSRALPAPPQPIKQRSDDRKEEARAPSFASPPSGGEEAGGGSAHQSRPLPLRQHGSYYRRDVGAVALLLPVEQTNLAHI